MAKPGHLDLYLVRGDDETIVWTFTTDGVTPVVITGRTYACQIRTLADKAGSGTPAGATTCNVTNGAAGQMTQTVAAAVTATLIPGAAYVYDLEETVSGLKATIFEGAVIVQQDVTK